MYTRDYNQPQSARRRWLWVTIAGAVVAIVSVVVAATLWTRGGGSEPGTTQGDQAAMGGPSGSEPESLPSASSGSPSPSASASGSAGPSKAAPKAPAPVPGGFPNASTTGVPAGIALRDASTDSHY